MAILNIDIPDASINEFYDAFASTYGYRQKLQDPNNSDKEVPNPETMREFAKRKVIEYILAIMESASVESAVKVARDAVRNQPKPNIR